MLFKAFGLCSLALDWDKWDIRDTIWDTLCDIAADRDGHGLSHPAPSLSVVHGE